MVTSLTLILPIIMPLPLIVQPVEILPSVLSVFLVVLMSDVLVLKIYITMFCRSSSYPDGTCYLF